MTYVDRFNQAVQTLDAGQPAEALALFQSVFAPDETDQLPDGEEITEPFFFEVRLRTAICHLQLSQWHNALAELESAQMPNYLKHVTPAQRFNYFIHYATAEFAIGRWARADACYSEALSIAVNELNDGAALEHAWKLRLETASRAQEWKMLLQLTLAASQSSKSNGLSTLHEVCTEMACLAYRGLYRFADARRGAELVRARLQAQHACPARIGRWTYFIADLNRTAA